MELEICGVCGENETGRHIEEVPVCTECFVVGGLNLPKNRAILKKVYDSPYKHPSEAAQEAPAPESPAEEEAPAAEPAPATSDKPEPPNQGFGNYFCPKCKVTHKAGSKPWKRHLKLVK